VSEYRITGRDGREHDVRPTGRSAQIFEECAEVLDTTTELIMAAHQDGRSVTALYTPGYPQDPMIWAARLRRNADGTLRLIARERQPGMHEQLLTELARKFGKDGDA
jgi:hypothetical protein